MSPSGRATSCSAGSASWPEGRHSGPRERSSSADQAFMPGVLLAVNWVIGRFRIRDTKLEHAFQGSPVHLVAKGQILDAKLRRSLKVANLARSRNSKRNAKRRLLLWTSSSRQNNSRKATPR